MSFELKMFFFLSVYRSCSFLRRFFTVRCSFFSLFTKKWKEVKIDGALCYIEHCVFRLCVCVRQTVCHSLFVIQNTSANRHWPPFSKIGCCIFFSLFALFSFLLECSKCVYTEKMHDFIRQTHNGSWVQRSIKLTKHLLTWWNRMNSRTRSICVWYLAVPEYSRWIIADTLPNILAYMRAENEMKMK